MKLDELKENFWPNGIFLTFDLSSIFAKIKDYLRKRHLRKILRERKKNANRDRSGNSFRF